MWFYVSAICVLLALPGGFALLLWTGSHLLIAVGTIGLLLILQTPVFLLLRRFIPRDRR